MSNQPTSEQTQWVWEQCGFEFWKPVENGAYDILFPDGSLCLGKMVGIDLNNLIRYAVPKLNEQGYYIVEISQDYPNWEVIIEGHNQVFSNAKVGESQDHKLEDALFWACFKCFGGKE